MRERGKAVETSCVNYNLPEFSYCSDLPCKEHPSWSPVGVCAYCLRDRLINLACSDCGEQRLSPCSFSEVSDLGTSVGRMSFSIKKEVSEANLKHSPQSKSQNGVRSEEEVAVLKRRSGIWRIAVRLFGKKRDKGCDEERRFVGVSRSRSLCSFRGGNSGFSFSSSAKISDVNGKSGFSEVEPRKSMRSFFLVEETELSQMDDSGFIDLKLGSSTESKPDKFSVLKTSDPPVSVSVLGGLRSGSLLEHHGSSFGGSCRITVKERGVQKDKKVHNRVLRWIFRAPS